MANDRNGTPISTGLVYAVAGECRKIDGDKIVVVAGTQPIACDAADIAQIDALGGGGGGEANTGSNVGASGVGPFDGKVAVDLQFRKIDAGSNKVTTALNGQKIDVDVVPANFTGIPQSGVTSLVADLAAKEAAGTAAGLIATHEGAADPHTGYQKESEKGAANGYASLGAGGLVPMAQLASGTPDGTKFVRDDGTLAAPAGGSGLTHAQTMSRVALRC